MFRAQFSQDQVKRREELIIKYVSDYIKDRKNNPDLFPYYGLDYCIKWAWPLRFARGNTTNGLKYYTPNAYESALQRNVRDIKRDHIVPHKTFVRILLNSTDISLSSIRNKLLKFGELCLVTREEHDLLLADRMPDGWSETDNPFARYIEAGIDIIENNGQWV